MCHTDNGSQFASKEYEDFATQYGFKHTTSSPYHPKGNGRAEAAVKVAKTTLKKSTDLQSALLNYRNTPPQGLTYSPAQRMLCLLIRTTLPTPNHLIKPSPVNLAVVTQELTLKRAASKCYYDSSPTKYIPSLLLAQAFMRNLHLHRGVSHRYRGLSSPRTDPDHTLFRHRTATSVETGFISRQQLNSLLH